MAVIDAQIEKVFDLVVAIQIKLTMKNWIWKSNSKAITLCAMCGYLIVSFLDTPYKTHWIYEKKLGGDQPPAIYWHLWALRACVMVKASPFRGWRIKGVAFVDTPGCKAKVGSYTFLWVYHSTSLFFTHFLNSPVFGSQVLRFLVETSMLLQTTWQTTKLW